MDPGVRRDDALRVFPIQFLFKKFQKFDTAMGEWDAN